MIPMEKLIVLVFAAAALCLANANGTDDDSSGDMGSGNDTESISMTASANTTSGTVLSVTATVMSSSSMDVIPDFSTSTIIDESFTTSFPFTSSSEVDNISIPTVTFSPTIMTLSFTDILPSDTINMSSTIDTTTSFTTISSDTSISMTPIDTNISMTPSDTIISPSDTSMEPSIAPSDTSMTPIVTSFIPTDTSMSPSVTSMAPSIAPSDTSMSFSLSSSVTSISISPSVTSMAPSIIPSDTSTSPSVTSMSTSTPFSTTPTSSTSEMSSMTPATSTPTATTTSTSTTTVTTSTPAVPTINTSSSPASSNQGLVVALSVLFTIVLVILAAVTCVLLVVLRVYIIKPKRSRDYELQKLELDGGTSDNVALLAVTSSDEMKLGDLFNHIPKLPPVELTALESHVSRLQDEDLAKDEFIGLSEYTREFLQTNAVLSANATKNRYINILPFDETRVILTSSKKEGSDYINANYIQGYNHTKEYIAAQGPLPQTVDDFWRMIWETGTEAIVMVTNPVEGGTLKCEVYWPQEMNAQQYGNISVSTVQESIEPSCTIRRFMVTQAKKVSSKDVSSRECTQYHFTGWPDMGVPNDSATMLRFVKRIRSSLTNDKPIVVHCSAGVGRTGTFIALDILLQRMASHENVNIKELILQMRAQRCNMVQTPAQYVFIYSSLLYEYWYGETLIHKDDLESHYERLQEAFPYTEDSRMDKEFEGAQNIIRPDPSVMKEAFNPNNTWKNREGSGLPFDFNRVPLSKGSIGNTYINASFVGCLGRSAEYILTQHPLADTSMDFWKMMLERHVNVLVVLGSVEEEDEYWPDSDPLEWYEEDITVRLTDRDEFKNIKASNLEIESDMNEGHQGLTMFQIANWPSDGTTPTDHFTIIELIENIHEIKTGLVAIHTAVGHEEASGVFAILCSLIPYISVSSKVNVMEVVRRTNQQRPGCIATRDQYEFIYETIIASLSEKKRQ